MFFELPGGPAAAVLLSLTPAILRLWWGRALARLAPLEDNPVLPERLLAHNTRFGVVSGACVALLVIGRPSWAVWTVPLLILAQTAAAWPLRRTLYQETWSLAAFLSFFGRLYLGALGFWILLAVTPWIASRAGRVDWIAAAALAAILAIWNRYSAAILRALWRTQPITDPALTSRFAALVSKCALAMPRFEYVPVPGGVVANAVALPSLRGSSVIFSETLLSRLSEDETIAIGAHELAHLEYYDRARLRRASAATFVLIAAAAVTAPLARVLSDSPEAGLFLWVWPCALFLAQIVRASRRQKNETASDLRAVALTGDAEALARALTTLHTIMLVPRRWNPERERRSTHPSLARRIRDIRAAAGVATAALNASTTFRAATSGTVVRFDATRLSWQEATGTSLLLDYANLGELRLNASTTGVVTLVAVEHGGRRREMVPETTDLPALQQVLDIVDGRLDARRETVSRPFAPAAARMVAVLGSLLALPFGHLAFAFAAVLALISPAPAILNGAAAAAFATAALMLRDGLPAPDPALPGAALFAALGAALLGVSRARRGASSRATTPLLAILAAGSVLAIVAVAFNGFSLLRLHQGARATPASVVLLVALAAACWTWRNRPALRYAAFVSLLGAGSLAILGSTLFMDRAVRDPFLVAAAPVTWTSLDGADSAEFDVPFGVDTLRLSPTGRLAAVQRADEIESDVTSASIFHVGRPGAGLSAVDAADLTFVDDHRALLLILQEGGAEVREVNFDDGAPVVAWRERIPDLQWGALTYEPSGNRWIVLGRDAAGQLVRSAGTVGSAGTESTTWPAPARERWLDAAATHGGAALIVEKHYVFGAAHWIAPRSIAPFLAPPFGESQVWRLRDGRRIDTGRSLLDTSCVNGALADGRLVCAAFDGIRTRIIAIDTDSAAVTGLMAINGHFRPDEVATRGWLTGWSNSRPVALRLATREAIRPPSPRGEFVNTMALTETVIGTASWKKGGSRIRVYPLR
jgi:Zn-dependent protease with chaperone function